MKIYLPNSAFLGNINPFIRSFEEKNPDHLEINANKKWISIHPMVLSMIAALGLTIRPENITCEILEAKSKHYLERMGLFKFLRISSGINVTVHESAGRFIPLTQIKGPNELSKFITDMIPLLHLEPDQSESIKYIVSELVRNVFEHSRSEHGAVVSAQYYAKSNTIRIGIADTGVGIKSTINHTHKAETDLEAIKLALTPGITGTTRREGGTESNAGAGLFFIKSIATANRDFFVIYSGNAMFKLLKRKPGARLRLFVNPHNDKHKTEESLPYWKGTVVGIDMSLDQTSEFTLLLDLIKESYSEAIREKKKARYKKPKFI